MVLNPAEDRDALALDESQPGVQGIGQDRVAGYALRDGQGDAIIHQLTDDHLGIGVVDMVDLAAHQFLERGGCGNGHGRGIGQVGDGVIVAAVGARVVEQGGGIGQHLQGLVGRIQGDQVGDDGDVMPVGRVKRIDGTQVWGRRGTRIDQLDAGAKETTAKINSIDRQSCAIRDAQAARHEGHAQRQVILHADIEGAVQTGAGVLDHDGQRNGIPGIHGGEVAIQGSTQVG